MRRTAALVGVATLAVGLSGVAGPANATDTQDAGVMVVDPILVEVGAFVDASSPDHNIDGNYAVLENRGTPDDLDGFTLMGCNTTVDDPILALGTSDLIGSGSTPFFLITDANYGGGPSPDNFSGNFSMLNTNDGGVYLTGPGGQVNGVEWGTPTACPAGLTAVSPPNVDDSLQLVSGSWILNTPNPRNTTSIK